MRDEAFELTAEIAEAAERRQNKGNPGGAPDRSGLRSRFRFTSPGRFGGFLRI